MADPKHPEHLDDPESLPILTDVIVPGRPPTPRHSEAHAPAVPQRAEEAPVTPQTSGEPPGSAHAAPAATAATAAPSATEEPGAQAGTPVRAAAEPPTPPNPADPMATSLAELTERDADHIAERLRGRFADYLREEGRRVIEARCREALDEHASWLIRQVTREVAHALEGEVAGWVRDAVRAELAAHQSQRR
jgi:Protein of unknown function (DUF2486)